MLVNLSGCCSSNVYHIDAAHVLLDRAEIWRINAASNGLKDVNGFLGVQGRRPSFDRTSYLRFSRSVVSTERVGLVVPN